MSVSITPRATEKALNMRVCAVSIWQYRGLHVCCILLRDNCTPAVIVFRQKEGGQRVSVSPCSSHLNSAKLQRLISKRRRRLLGLIFRKTRPQKRQENMDSNSDETSLRGAKAYLQCYSTTLMLAKKLQAGRNF